MLISAVNCNMLRDSLGRFMICLHFFSQTSLAYISVFKNPVAYDRFVSFPFWTIFFIMSMSFQILAFNLVLTIVINNSPKYQITTQIA